MPAFLKNIPEILIMITIVGILLVCLSVMVMFLVWLERRLLAFIQDRQGPNRVGPQGILQSVADGIKLFLKESIIPTKADKPLFFLAPILVFVPAVMSFAVFPINQDLSAVNLNVGLLYLFSLSSVIAMGILLAGWSSNNKYSLLGALRLVAKNISYEIPLVLSTLGVVMITGSLNLGTIVSAQSQLWFILLQPLGFLIYFISAIAEVNRSPFDVVEAESELIGGFHTEYSGFMFALFFFAEYLNTVVISLIASTLFLGGPTGPFLPGIIWLIIKTYGFIILMMWIRGTLVRFRIDQLLGFCWKRLVPLALLNLVITALGITIWHQYLN
ncbi:NADH-quinone oxidoreductase subunit NuoH [Candidatus Peregrinibacteria bacterium]|nr:NADH-quinone oxidoreductase subunit NuoH [Candidatus Peregrinibacteria bacterium]